jgi:hypothetical protein
LKLVIAIGEGKAGSVWFARKESRWRVDLRSVSGEGLLRGGKLRFWKYGLWAAVHYLLKALRRAARALRRGSPGIDLGSLFLLLRYKVSMLGMLRNRV